MIDSDILSLSENNDLSSENIEVFPNPFTNNLKLILKNIESREVQVQIFNINGKKVFDEILINSDNVISINTLNNNMEPGTYFYKITSGTYTKSGKLIKVD